FLTLDASGNTIEPNPNPGTKIPGGAYTLKAHYGGDTKFAQSDDPTGVSVTVTPEASHVFENIITFDNAGNVNGVGTAPFTLGSPYILRVDIGNSVAMQATCQTVVVTGTPLGNTTECATDATGKVMLTDNGSPLDQGTFNLNSEGHFEDQI